MPKTSISRGVAINSPSLISSAFFFFRCASSPHTKKGWVGVTSIILPELVRMRYSFGVASRFQSKFPFDNAFLPQESNENKSWLVPTYIPSSTNPHGFLLVSHSTKDFISCREPSERSISVLPLTHFATPGSPTRSRCISPLTRDPSGKSLGTPAKSWSTIASFIS